jgi:cytochrome c
MAKESEVEKTKSLIQKNCATCHTLEMPPPNTISSLPAPPMNAIVFHLKRELKSYEKQKEFIVNYSLNPKAELSVCDMTKVKRYGVMPSLKGTVSKKDLILISTHLLENFPSKEFIESRAEAKLYQEIHKLRNAPFLLNQSSLPKITKLLMQNWGKGKLGLSKDQKKKLLKIRIRVSNGIKEIKEKLYLLERDIIEMTIYADELELIKPKVNEASKLKSQATMIQIQCIIETVKILTEEQLSILVPLWGV